MGKSILRLKTFYIIIMSFIFMSSLSLFGAVSIDRTTPIGENTSRANYEAITVTFNQQMVALQAVKEVTNQYFSFNIDVKGKYLDF